MSLIKCCFQILFDFHNYSTIPHCSQLVPTFVRSIAFIGCNLGHRTKTAFCWWSISLQVWSVLVAYYADFTRIVIVQGRIHGNQAYYLRHLAPPKKQKAKQVSFEWNRQCPNRQALILVQVLHVVARFAEALLCCFETKERRIWIKDKVY